MVCPRKKNKVDVELLYYKELSYNNRVNYSNNLKGSIDKVISDNEHENKECVF